jgi:hypothetical protein
MFEGGNGGPQWTPEMRAMMEKVLPKDVTALIKSLIPMLASQAFIWMGKVDNPMLGRPTRDLGQAHLAVECAVALLEKLDPMLAAEDRASLRQMIAELQMHYVQARSEG